MIIEEAIKAAVILTVFELVTFITTSMTKIFLALCGVIESDIY
jgi:hypothetical protein